VDSPRSWLTTDGNHEAHKGHEALSNFVFPKMFFMAFMPFMVKLLGARF
jgi:hypothetical protein